MAVAALPPRAPVVFALLLLALLTPPAVAQTDIPQPPQFDTLPEEPFHWPIVAARLWSDSSYTFRQAALESYVDPAGLAHHTVEYRDSADVGPGYVVIKVLVNRPLTNAEIGELLAFYIGQHPIAEVVASVALSDTTGADSTAIKPQTLVVYMYLDYGHVDHEWGEFFCIGGRVPEGLIVDEGEFPSIPRCDDTIGGDPWPIATRRQTVLAYARVFLQTGLGLLGPLVPVLLVFGALYAVPRRKNTSAEAGRMESGTQAGKIALALVLAATLVTAALTTVVYSLNPGSHPVSIGFTLFVSRQLKIAYQLAVPFVLLLVVLAPVRVEPRLPAQAPSVRKITGIVIALALLLVPVYGWIGPYGTPQDFMATTWQGLMQAAVNGGRINRAMVASATIDLTILGLSIAVIGPIAEEFFWRGMTLPILERHLGSIFAVAVTAVLFGLSHLNFAIGSGLIATNAVWAFVIGLITGAIFVRRRSLAWCVGAHAIWNGAAYGAALLCAVRG